MFVAWVDRRDVGLDIYFNRSLQFGEPGTWLLDDLRLDTGEAAGLSDSQVPDLAVGDGKVAVAWHDRRFGDSADILVATADAVDPVFAVAVSSTSLP